ncbi:winged helix DNA-binding protein [Microvirga lotononidis]|uniref:Transcriptional regulator n=1 Tax=Microvirga lotononidis TaxID=864069 RepID=I4YLD5_9HYPH|nr:winged helix DNA-binding protein [Microvirga lotononidis]EIM24777.1 transcriptional regulator [Microvirga lotononidis]WQO25416.1 MarR family transcriptional regulator [Microvirga lotononidis]
MQNISNSLPWVVAQDESDPLLPTALQALTRRGDAPASPTEGSEAPQGEQAVISHIEIVRVIERLHRRSLDLVRADLIEAGIDDLSPSQVMMLFTIGSSELSVRDLIERGYYLGSNASYSLKRLVEAEYVIRTASERDRRSARIRLSEKGRALCDMIRQNDKTYQQLMARNEAEVRNLETTFRTLKRIEQTWSNAVRYRDMGSDE